MFSIKNKRSGKTNEYFFATAEEATAFLVMAKEKTQSVIDRGDVSEIVQGVFHPNGKPMSAFLEKASFLEQKYEVIESAKVLINGVAIDNDLADDSGEFLGGKLSDFISKKVQEMIILGESVISVQVNGEEKERVSLISIFNDFGEEDPTKLPYSVACGVLFGDYKTKSHPAMALKSALESIFYAAQRVVSQRLQTLEDLAKMLKSI